METSVAVPMQQYADLLANYSNLRTVLRAAKEKLALYRAQHSGEYIGGMEYRMLVNEIDAALNPQPQGA